MTRNNSDDRALRRPARSRMAAVLALIAAALCPPPTQAAAPGPPDSTAAARPALHDSDPRPPAALFGPRDAIFAIATVGVLAIIAPHDEWLTHESDQTRAPGEQTLARSAQPLGNGAVVVPALVGSWLVARAAGRREAAGTIGRIGACVGAAGVGAFALKEIVGRPRPFETPNDSDDLFPLSGHTSFPSGHAALSFALATAINRESSWRGTPWITYPVATLVGWSRVHDHEHWTSDVVAGAALGIWTAHKVEDVLHPAPDSSPRIHVGLRFLDGAPALALTLGR